MKIAVLGANGFLGKFICNSLKEELYEVLPITRKDLDLLNFNEVKNWLVQNSPDIIVNCAISVEKGKYDAINFDHIKNNLGIFLNFYNNDQYFNRFINIGSGAEFDLSRDINSATESEIFDRIPNDSYGYSKNTISRLILPADKFYTLRLFGCFHSSEEDFRLFKLCFQSTPLALQNKNFDYISAEDFYIILKTYFTENNLPKDINCVYKDKIDLKSILYTLIGYHNLDTKFVEIEKKGLNYTGDGSKLESLNLPLSGLYKSLKEYKI